MKQLKDKLEGITNIVLDVILGILALIMLVSICKLLYKLGGQALTGYSDTSFETIIHSSLSFFMYFEFLMMVKKYIDEDHHIPTRYLIYIAITAILRQELVIHDDAMETLILSIAIFLLAVTLILLKITDYKVPPK